MVGKYLDIPVYVNHVEFIRISRIRRRYISGHEVGRYQGTLVLTNVYTGGKIGSTNAGGLIGSIDTALNKISITMSVYDGKTGNRYDKHK